MNTTKRLVALFTLLLFLGSPAVGADDGKIKLMVIYDPSPPLKVSLITQKDMNRALGAQILFGRIGANATQEHLDRRSQQHSEQLIKTVGDFPRVPLFKENLAKIFSQQADRFELKILTRNEADEYTSDKWELEFETLHNQGWRYVLLLKETTGYASAKTNLGKLGVWDLLDAKLYDTTTLQVIFEEQPDAVHDVHIELEQALSDRNFFVSNYEAALRKIFQQLYSRLNGTDTLHEMAEHYGLADKFPPVAKTLKSYAKRFELDQALPQGWKEAETENAYLFIAEPKKDRDFVAVVASVDLLIAALGQDFEDISQYYDFRLSKLRNIGWDTAAIGEAPKMELKDKWDSYTLPNPRGGKTIFLHRKVGQEFVLTYEVILLGENREKFFEQYKTQIESYINDTVFKIK
jgi:hypothetical protein